MVIYGRMPPSVPEPEYGDPEVGDVTITITRIDRKLLQSIVDDAFGWGNGTVLFHGVGFDGPPVRVDF